jgi:D-alanyl-D-alanine dipeptidase
MRSFKIILTGLFTLFIMLGFSWKTLKLPNGFVYIQDHIPNAILDIRYSGPDNFVGKPVNGYLMPVGIITIEAVQALKKVQKELAFQELRLKIFDAYRPQKAVDHFSEWAVVLNDTLTKHKYYPNVEKSDLFKLQYIASKSGHSRGSTVDLTLVNQNGTELDMGTPWDYFGPESWPSNTDVSNIAQKNRLILQKVMIKYGFKPYYEEWWHFTLKNEPFPNTYFNFDIK